MNELYTLLEEKIKGARRQRRRAEGLALSLAVLLAMGGGASLAAMRHSGTLSGDDSGLFQQPAQQITEKKEPDSSQTDSQGENQLPREEGNGTSSSENGDAGLNTELSETKYTHQIRLDWGQETPHDVSVSVLHGSEEVVTLELGEDNLWKDSWQDSCPTNELDIRLESDYDVNGMAKVFGDEIVVVVVPDAGETGQAEGEKLPQTGQNWQGCLWLASLGVGFCLMAEQLRRRRA